MDLPDWGRPLVTVSSGQGWDEPTTDDLLSSTLQSPWQRLQDKLTIGYSSPDATVIQLIDLGCGGAAEDTIHACAAACPDANAMFGTWQATWNCLSLATVSEAARLLSDDIDSSDGAGNLRRGPSDDMGPYLMASVTDEIYKHGLNMTNFNGTAVMENMYKCAQASCRNDGASCAFSFPNLQDVLDNDNFEWPLSLGNSFCDGVRGAANPDIAGPGVSDERLGGLVSA
jgi:hypothetical protein